MRNTIDMAREAGFEAMRGHGLLPHVPEDIFIANACVTEEVNRLVALVRAEEREACAKACEDAPEPDGYDLAKRIRARGEIK